MIRILFIVFWCSSCCNLNAQKKDLLCAIIQYHPTDFFGSIGVQREFQQIGYNFNFGCGINRTFFQQRLYPKVNIGVLHDWFPAEKLQLVSEARCSFAYLNAQKNMFHSSTKTSEFAIFTHFGYGLKQRISIGVGLGKGIEWIGKPTTIFHYWLYMLEVNYAFKLH